MRTRPKAFAAGANFEAFTTDFASVYFLASVSTRTETSRTSDSGGGGESLDASVIRMAASASFPERRSSSALMSP